MQSRNLKRSANRVCKAVTSGQRAYSSFDRDFYYLTSAIARDFDRSLRRRVSPLDFFGPSPSMFSEPVVYYRQPVHSTFEQKTITSDENGRVVVKTQRKVPGRAWETYVEEYTNDKSLEQNKKPEAITEKQEASMNHKTTTSETSNQQQKQTIEQSNGEADKAVAGSVQNTNQQTPSSQSSAVQPTQSNGNMMLRSFDEHFRQLSDSMMRDFDDFFGIRHPFFNSGHSSSWYESDMNNDMPNISDNATYHAKTIINNNGKVTVKTVSKQPGSAWETSVKQYGENGALNEGQQKEQAIESAKESEQKSDDKASESSKNEQQGSIDQTINH